MTSIIGFLIVGIVFGFLSAAILQQALKHLLRFHAEWTSTFIACALTAMTSAVTLLVTLLAFGSVAFVISGVFAVVIGTGACRLVIRSQSGRQLPTALCVGVAVVLVVPALAGYFIVKLLSTA